MSFIRIFIEIYTCFTACFTVEFTIAPNTPIYNHYQAVFFARRAIILEKNRPGDEANSDPTINKHTEQVKNYILIYGTRL